MIVNLDGKQYNYDPTKITVATAMVIKDRSGWGLKSFAKAVDDWDPLAAQLLYFAIKAQANEPCDPSLLTFNIPEFMQEIERSAMEVMKADLLAEQLEAERLEAEGKDLAAE